MKKILMLVLLMLGCGPEYVDYSFYGYPSRPYQEGYHGPGYYYHPRHGNVYVNSREYFIQIERY